MYLFYYYIPIEPKSSLELVNSKLLELGLGTIGEYSDCCWITQGRGQFKPLDNSNPTLGSHNKLELVDEYKVEMICPNNLKTQAISLLKHYHPYETPAYGFIQIDT